MGMGDVDRGQTLPETGDPIGQLRRLRFREEGIDEHGILLAVDQRGRVRHPFQLVLAGRCALRRAGAPADEQLPLQGRAVRMRLSLTPSFPLVRRHTSAIAIGVPL